MTNHVSLHEVVNEANRTLQPSAFRDYCPNGLQVEGKPEVRRIVSAVTASLETIERAIELNADVLLVHHGYFWKGEDPVVTGMKQRRLKALLTAGVSLLAYHLPLDAHSSLGNNAELARLLGWTVEGGLDTADKFPVGFVGTPKPKTTIASLSADIEALTGQALLRVGQGPQEIKRIAWCTGAAQSMIQKAYDQGVDCFISGEISEPTVHAANELGIHYIAAGHHATERYGVQALGAHLAQQFGIEHQFVDLPIPV
ncbi:Nif3-like dinuclear metal center hexameric protein [Pokkaliibacter sp. CJK22405]|uniref:Nif3-like dinuclear metal center hexameric protein n=1 Tax=Pokkaliibacter sp. CJK22405 TaxID=3384615 RepID=UPI0039848407